MMRQIVRCFAIAMVISEGISMAGWSASRDQSWLQIILSAMVPVGLAYVWYALGKDAPPQEGGE